MEIIGHFLLSISIVNHFTSVLCQCDGNVLPVSVPSLDRIEFTYPINSSVSYGINLDCQWLFESTNTRLVFVFHVTNLLVHCGDVLKVYDGSSRSASQLTSSICSSSDSPSTTSLYKTSSNQMLVSLQTDDRTNSDREKGFTFKILSARTRAYDSDACNSNIKTLTATTDEQYITSPLFPEHYRSNTFCKWNITSQADTVSIGVTVRFLDVDVDPLNSACTDNISVSDGQTQRVLCSAASFDPQTLTSNTSFVLIHFYSDDNTEGRGFLLAYSTLEDQTTSSTADPATTVETTTSLETIIETTSTTTLRTTSIETTAPTTTITETTTPTTTTASTTTITETTTTITETTAPTTTITETTTSTETTAPTTTITETTAPTTTITETTAPTTTIKETTAPTTTITQTTVPTTTITQTTVPTTTITQTTVPTTTITMVSTSSTVSTISSISEESSPSPAVSSTASNRLTPKSEVTFEAVIVLTVFTFLVLVVGITATTVACFSIKGSNQRQISITSSDSQSQNRHWSHRFDEINTVHNHYPRTRYTRNKYSK